ncbi:peptidylprolyl isomerase [Candidatus Dojkabacteria bacterium]|nr:peptidylprolyl isomerase [Candidatus Dojkabacteria bacterium]
MFALLTTGCTIEKVDDSDDSDVTQDIQQIESPPEEEFPFENITEEGKNYFAIIKTNMGDFKIEFFADKVPMTVSNFIILAKEDYFDGILFHRVIDQFMIQGGDPEGTGMGGPGYQFPDEFHKELSNLKGTISMANSGPDTNGSQFFINLVDNTQLDYDKEPSTSKHAVFGKVVEGMDVVEEIGKVETGALDKPIEDVVIEDVIIEEN